MPYFPTGINRFLTLFFMLLASMSLSGQLLFNEVMAVNEDGEFNEVIGEAGDWIEIYNGTPYGIDLSGYYLSDDPDKPFKWRFPQNSNVARGGYHLVWTDATNDTLSGSHTNFKLAASGETLYLHNLKGELYDSLRFPRMYENVSYGISDIGARVYFSVPSPGSTNDSQSGYLVSGDVEFGPPPSLISAPTLIHLIPEEADGTIRYTLDGRPPGLSDPVYTSPILVSENTVIRARLWSAGFEPGQIATASYLMDKGFTLPVISLVTDPANLFDEQTGIYVAGTNGSPGYCEDEPRNWNMDWERPMSMEYFDIEGSLQIQQDGGTKIHGGCSRQAPLKSLAFFARSKYGNSQMNYPFFSQKDADSFKGLIFRNSGNDFWYSFIRDAVMQAVVAPHMDLDDQAYEPVQLFINGEYWGIHNLREKVNENWVTSNYGIPDENIDFVKNNWELFAGNFDAYENLNNYLANNSLENEENYQYVAGQVDIESYQDYLITQMFFANRDWPGNNQKCWRDRVNGSKWRWILFDLDFGFGLYNNSASFDMFSFSTADTSDQWPNPAWSTLMIRRLLENDGFRSDFIKKYSVHLNTTLSTENVNHVIDSLYYNLYDIFPAHLERWNQMSMEDWANHVDYLRLFATARPAHVRRNMRNFFSLGDDIPFHVQAPDSSGLVMANGVVVSQNGLKGFYSAGMELDLEFLPNPGYQFSHWEVIDVLEEEEVVLPRNSSWKYYDTGDSIGKEWRDVEFDDSSWSVGLGELGYGDGGEQSLLDFGPDDQNKHISYYFRKQVEIGDSSISNGLKLRIIRDDGAVVYINGREALRDNMPGFDILSGTLALTAVGNEAESTYFEYFLESGLFVPGTNVIAVEIHQNSPGSSDISFDLEIAASIQAPGDTLVYEGNPLSINPTKGLMVRAASEVSHQNLDVKLHINEFMASNQDAVLDEFGENADWIEIYNAGDEDVNLGGFYMTDDLKEPAKWQIPDNHQDATTIKANDYLVFYADGDILQGPLHLDFKLSAGGEAIGLTALSGSSVIWIDSIRFGPQLTDISQGRFPDGNIEWNAMAQFTPGASNLITETLTSRSGKFTLHIFPNPVADMLHIRLRLEPPGEDRSMALYDLTGRMIIQERLEGWNGEYAGNMEVSGLTAGVYILIIDNGRERISGKIIKVDSH